MLQPSAVVELIWQDASGSTSTTTVFAASSLTVADIDASASALASLIVPLTDCVLIGQRIKYKTAYEVHTDPDSDTPVSHAMALFFTAGGDTSAGVLTVPSINDGVFVTDGPGAGAVVDLGNADVSSLVTTVLDSGICNPFAVPFDDVFSGYLQSRV